jgi:hypothetical protein
MNKEGHGEFRLLLFMLSFAIAFLPLDKIVNSTLRIILSLLCFILVWGLMKLFEAKNSADDDDNS